MGVGQGDRVNAIEKRNMVIGVTNLSELARTGKEVAGIIEAALLAKRTATADILTQTDQQSVVFIK